jgi:hypothetical protein
MLLAGGSGLYLYQSKHRAQMLDREIERTLKATDTAKDRIGVLRGEWALLNEPERLAGLSQSHLGLKTLMPGQFVTAAELGARLPPVVVPDAVQMPGEDEPPTPTGEVLPTPPAPASGVPTRPIAAVKAAPVPPSAPPRAPAQIASALQPPASPLPRPVPPRSVLAPIIDVSAGPIAAASAPKPVPARPATASSASAGQGIASARPAAPSPGGTSIGESVLRAARLRGGAQAANTDGPAPQPANNAPAPSEPSSSPAIASALGGARPPLPRPVPLGSATAGSLASVR